ncbi:MAG TPA: DUF2339 domain-containing protein [Ideonella sp.]|uniref:DUF2339 domain-containing protein n=1 Tax=Ideonella sp. TaxID=1929293 RepID=UPI002E32D977|nr:DUF2339 domain-containing protein [Ideonella sp.]HEX5687968.1 DUF2339 domain-containing protein [Ideonella sp.]
MKWFLGLIGAVLGMVMGGFEAALVGALLGVGGAVLVQRNPRRQQEEPGETGAPVPLDVRVAALEQKVSALQAEVARLKSAGPDVQVAAAEQAMAPATEPAAPNPTPTPVLVVRPSVPAPAALARNVEPTARVPLTPPPPLAPVPHMAVPVTAPSMPDGAAKAGPAPVTPPPGPAPVVPVLPAVPLKDRLPPFLRDWIFGGNTIVKVGVLVLFLGLAFLLRYAAERVTVPPELRYAGVALLGIGLLALGWRLRERRDAAGGTGYGLILQGAGIGVLYLTTLASLKLNALIAPEPAFVFLFAVTVLSAVLAVVQNAPWLAYVAVAEGFAAPVLVSSGGGHHHVLFSYMALLDVGVFLIAWFRAWRPLNLVAFVGTFTLAGAWAHGRYEPSLYTGVQAYLLLFFLLFTLIGVLFARRALALGTPPAPADPLAQRAAQTLAQVGRVDSALVFGVPLVAFGLQYLLVQDWEFGPAWAAMGYAMFYLLLGGVTMRRGGPRYALLGEAYVIVSVIFGTLAIPLALEGAWTGATWAIEAAGMYWLGTRQHRPYARAFALLVLAGAAVRTFSALGIDESVGTPLLTGSVLGMALLAVGALAMHAVSLRVRDGESTVAPWETIGQAGQLAIGLAALTAMAWMLLVPAWACVATSALALGVALLPMRWRSPALPWSVACLQALALSGFVATLQVLHGQAMLGSGWSGLVAAVLIAASLMASAVLAMPAGLRQRFAAPDEQAEPPVWPLGATLGLLAGAAALGGSLLFVLPADQAARLWPALGLAALWAGLRLRHAPMAVAGWAWQVVAGVACVAYGVPLWSPETTGLTLWTPLVLTLAALISGDMVRDAAQRETTAAWLRLPAVQWGLVVWALLWWAQVLPPEIWRGLRRNVSDWPGWWTTALGAWVLLSSLLLTLVARWRDWRVLGQSTWATVPAWAWLAWISVAVVGDAPHAHGGWLLWPVALVWHALLLQAQPRWAPPKAQVPMHLLGFWLFVALAAREGQALLAMVGAPGSAWSALGWVLAPASVLALITRPALQQRWPLHHFREVYLLFACAPVAGYLLLWVWLSNGLAGQAAPLPYVPLLNPLELGHGVVLLSLLLWFRALPDSAQRWLPRPLLLAGLGATAFVLYTGMLLRACHHLAGVPWDGSELFASTLTQATLSVAWAILGVGLMVLGHKKARRVVWVVGAGLLALVVAKLFFIELADHGGLYRIVSFIVVGLLLLLVGYFAPVPPRRDGAANDEVAA